MLVDVGDRSFSFRHELARAAIYDAVPAPRKGELHARTLAALQSMPRPLGDLALLAHHAEAAGDRHAVLRFAPEAARRAATLRAHRESAAQYDRALRFAENLPPRERAELFEACSYECYLTGNVKKAIKLRREALQIWRELDERLREGDALRWASRLSWFVGRNDEAVAAAEEALTVLSDQPPGRELAMALSNRAQLHMLAAENELAIVWGERAMALAQALDETEIYVHALNNAGTARLTVEEAQGRIDLERSLALAEAAGLEEHAARAYTNLSWHAVHVHDFTRANAYFDAGIAYATDHGLDPWRLYMLSWRAYLRLFEGDWSAAEADASRVLTFRTATEINRIAALTVQGLLRARRGDPNAEELLNEALALAVSTGELHRLGPVRLARSEAAWLKGDHALAALEARAVLDLTHRVGSRWDVGELYLWLARAGSLDAIGSPVDSSGLPEPHGHALAGNWAASASAWRALGCPYETALALLDGDETALREALALFKSMDARSAEAIAMRRLRDLGVRKIPRGPRPATRANPASLTARELQILPLLAAGRQNAEIADHFFLSAKTIDHHVGSILAKLGVHARGEVAAAARQLGISVASD